MQISLGTIVSSAIGAFIGRTLSVLFIVVCITLGVGPQEWALFLLGDAVAPVVARLVFVLLAVVTAFLLGLSIWTQRPQQGWRLTEQQLRSAKAAISGISASVHIIRTASVSRIEVVHAQLVGVFRDAGWEVKEWPTLDAHQSSAPIELAVTPIMQPHVINAIRKALTEAGLQFAERDTSGEPGPPVVVPRLWLSFVPPSVAV